MITQGGGAGWRPHAVALSLRARRDLSGLSDDQRAQVARALARFATEGHGDVRKLRDVRPPAYRLRVGDWRVLFVITPDRFDVERIVNRRDAY